MSPRSASAPVANPGPRYGGRFPGSCSSNPARAVQLIVPASAPLPLAGIFEESRASWTRKARRLPPAVGAGPLSAGGWGHPPLRKEVRTIGKRTRAWCKQPWRPIHFRPRKNSKVSAYSGHYGPPFTCYSGKRKWRRRGEGAKAWNLFRDGAEAKRSFAERFFAWCSDKSKRCRRGEERKLETPLVTSQKRNAVSQKVLLPTFLTRKVGALVPGLGRERLSLRGATQFQNRLGLFPLAFCCGKGTAPVSGPAGSAVFGRVRLRKVLSADGISLCPAVSRLLMRRRSGTNACVTGRRGRGWGS